MYTIKEAAARAGISVPLLRAWERRYGVVTPDRTASGYRLYGDDAVTRVRAMRRLVADGWTPSAAAESLRGADDVTIRDIAERPRAGEEIAAERDGLAERFVAAAAALDSDGVEHVLDEMFARGSFETVAEALLLPALDDLGDAWAAGRLDVAAEHAASHAVLRRLSAAFQAAGPAPRGPGAILVGLPPGARHELGALAFGVVARRAGLPVLYLGPDLPIQDWIDAPTRTRARGGVIGAVTEQDVDPARRVGIAVGAAHPRLLIAFGGRAAIAHGASLVAGANRAIVLPAAPTAGVAALAAALEER